MGVFKEEAHILENVARKQQRIFRDSADFGYPYNTADIPQDIRDLINVVNGFKQRDKRYHELPFIRNRQEWSDGVSLDVVIFWEADEGYYWGTKYSISFNKISGKHPELIDRNANAFISINVSRHKERVR